MGKSRKKGTRKMNANEFIDKYEKALDGEGEIDLVKTYIILRQQQAEIEALKAHPVKELTDEAIHQAIRRGFARDGFLSDGIFLEIKELLRKAQQC
jgi:hypothetical protein